MDNAKGWIVDPDALFTAMECRLIQPGDELHCVFCKGPHVFLAYLDSDGLLLIDGCAALLQRQVIGWKPKRR